MRSEIIDTVPIYEINGMKCTGQQKIHIRSHPRFLSFVKLRIDDQEYSVGCDDLMRSTALHCSFRLRLMAPSLRAQPA